MSAPAIARRLALEVLRGVSGPGATLAETFLASEPSDLEERDRALLRELVLGTLRRRGMLDHVLAPLTDRPIERVSPAILDVLRLGAYQLLFTRVAAHAALSESVELARSVEPRAAGFVNAVLRRLQRSGPAPEPDPDRETLLWLSSWGSLPVWLARRWLDRLGPDRAVARARALLDAPPTHLRLNPRLGDATARLAAAGVLTAPLLVPPGALELQEGRLTALAQDGALYVQDAGSQLVGHLAATDGLVLDACAAPGGKSLMLADLGGPSTRVVAAEASRRRLATLQRLVRRWGADRIAIVNADARRPPFRGGFDTVLLDAPCSGLGTLARHPDIRWRLRPADVDRHGERQRELINTLAPQVARGGRLVYATCSVEREENEDVVLPFLASHPEFSPEGPPAWAARHADGSFLRLEPGPHGDGFFIAKLRRAKG